MGKKLWKIEEIWSQKPKTPLFRTEYVDFLFPDIFSFKSFFNKQKSKHAVYSDSYGQYFGLFEEQHLKISGKDVFIVNNHNKMLFPLYSFFQKKGAAFDVVHLDAHPDDAPYLGKRLPLDSEADIYDTYKQSRISDFFDALSHKKIIGNILRYTDSGSIQNFNISDLPQDFFLSLDIDILGPEGDFCPFEDRVVLMRELWEKASCICVAMSPGFINQDFAIDVVDIILKIEQSSCSS